MTGSLTNIRYLHIVRGLAALLVVFFHSKYVFWVGGAIYSADIGLHTPVDYLLFSLDMLSSCGKECVIVFFILSAFVLKHTSLQQQTHWGQFYKLRVVRIYIPFLFSLLFSIIILFVCVKLINPAIYSNSVRQYNTRLYTAVNELSLPQVIRTIFFIYTGEFSGANYACWSLGHELIFYIMFPLYILLKRNMLILLSMVFALLFWLSNNHIFYYQVFFLAGLLLYDYFSNYSSKPVISNRKMYQLVLIFFFVIVNLSNKIVSEKFSDMVTLFYTFFIFDYILYFVNSKNAALMKLGDISYTLYLNHLPLLLLAYSLLTLYTGKLVFYNRWPYYGGVLFALLLAIPLYLLVEKPSIRLLKKLRSSQ